MNHSVPARRSPRSLKDIKEETLKNLFRGHGRLMPSPVHDIGGLDRRLLAWSLGILRDYPRWLKYRYSSSFDGLSLTKSNTGWLCVLRCTYRNTPRVAFVDGDNPGHALVSACVRLFTMDLKWRVDLYRK